jgi:hypothetical protein
MCSILPRLPKSSCPSQNGGNSGRESRLSVQTDGFAISLKTAKGIEAIPRESASALCGTGMLTAEIRTRACFAFKRFEPTRLCHVLAPGKFPDRANGSGLFEALAHRSVR